MTTKKSASAELQAAFAEACRAGECLNRQADWAGFCAAWNRRATKASPTATDAGSIGIDPEFCNLLYKFGVQFKIGSHAELVAAGDALVAHIHAWRAQGSQAADNAGAPGSHKCYACDGTGVINQCVICGSSEAGAGTCGSDDPRALCKFVAPASPAAAEVTGERTGEIEKAEKDWHQCGTFVMQGDKRIDPFEIFKPPATDKKGG